MLLGDINFRIYHVFCPKSTICASQDALVSQGMTLSRSEKEISRSIANKYTHCLNNYINRIGTILLGKKMKAIGLKRASLISVFLFIQVII